MQVNKIFFGDESISFLLVIAIRAGIMFALILLFLRLLGKRGVKQLSVFELVVILGLGSAAGDPMIYNEIGVVNAVVAFAMILLCYKLLTILVSKFKWIEHLVEGKEVYIIKKGKFAIEDFKKETLSKDEFFMELRLQGVFHLGQVECAILEISGEISVFFFDSKHIRFGLPILPDSLQKTITSFNHDTYYACTFCGNTVKYHAAFSLTCNECGTKEWVKASNRKRNT